MATVEDGLTRRLFLIGSTAAVSAAVVPIRWIDHNKLVQTAFRIPSRADLRLIETFSFSPGITDKPSVVTVGRAGGDKIMDFGVGPSGHVYWWAASGHEIVLPENHTLDMDVTLIGKDSRLRMTYLMDGQRYSETWRWVNGKLQSAIYPCALYYDDDPPRRGAVGMRREAMGWCPVRGYGDLDEVFDG